MYIDDRKPSEPPSRPAAQPCTSRPAPRIAAGPEQVVREESRRTNMWAPKGRGRLPAGIVQPYGSATGRLGESATPTSPQPGIFYVSQDAAKVPKDQALRKMILWPRWTEPGALAETISLHEVAVRLQCRREAEHVYLPTSRARRHSAENALWRRSGPMALRKASEPRRSSCCLKVPLRRSFADFRQEVAQAVAR
jgi:hypothetical protein